jgi:hypothetical protein
MSGTRWRNFVLKGNYDSSRGICHMQQPQLGMPDTNNKGTIMLWLIQKNGGCHVRFQPQVTLQTENIKMSIFAWYLALFLVFKRSTYILKKFPQAPFKKLNILPLVIYMVHDYSFFGSTADFVIQKEHFGFLPDFCGI